MNLFLARNKQTNEKDVDIFRSFNFQMNMIEEMNDF